jgi:hypothetical protein
MSSERKNKSKQASKQASALQRKLEKSAWGGNSTLFPKQGTLAGVHYIFIVVCLL